MNFFSRTKEPIMDHALDPENQIVFITQTGDTYIRSCYWENLYTFAYGQKHILVADRTVPHTNLYEALYDAFRGHQGETLSHRLLPEILQKPLLNVAQQGQTVQPFVESVSALIPTQNQTLPEELLKKTESQLEEVASQALVERGIVGGLGSFSSNDATPFLSDTPSSNNPLYAAHGVEQEDKQLVALSVQVDAAIKTQMRNIMKDDALVLYGDPEFDLSARLYTNPRYLVYVHRLLKAKGSYASPIIRDFLSFYSKCLNIKLNTHAQETHTDHDTLKKRLESTLGHEKGTGHHAFDYHELTILGFIIQGSPNPAPEDPDQTDYSFKLDPHTDLQTIRLQEIKDQRFLIRKFVHHTYNTHHNVRNVNYIDEADTPSKDSDKVIPAPIKKAIHQVDKNIDEWLGINKTKLMSAAIGWVIFALILTFGIVAYSILQISNSQ